MVWSPDGNRFAYYSSSGRSPAQAFSLVLASADGSQSVVIPLPSVKWVAVLGWSLDSQYLVVGDYHYVWLIHATNGHAQLLAAITSGGNVNNFQWSPHGHLLAYLWSATTSIPDHVVIFDPDTASEQRLARADGKYWWSAKLLWSADLRYIAAVGWADGLLDIFGLDGSAVSLNGAGRDNKSLAAFWVPFSDQFVFMTDHGQIIAYKVTTSSYGLLADNVPDAHVELLADQRSLVFGQTLPDGTRALVKLDVWNNRLTPLLTSPGWIPRFHVLSDHKKVVVLWGENNILNVDLVDTETHQRHQLATALSDFAMQHAWDDPDTFMFYWRQTDKNVPATIRKGWDVYDLAGKRRQRFQGDLATFTGILDADTGRLITHWSPNGHYAVFTSNNPSNFKGVLVASGNGEVAWRLSHSGLRSVDNAGIRWSSDSSKVAFTANIDGRAIILVYSADGKLLAVLKNSLALEYVHWTTCYPYL